ncbi:MAG: 50S ribosomal protein L23 [Rickettsiales bacterium]|nr:50S ribosomal protein L23 [Rickettsiales bacterium]
MTERMYDILERPYITEKTSRASEQGKVVFKIAPGATKSDVKNAVEKIYNVKVKSVNIAMKPGKVKRFKGVKGETSAVKKAYVTLADGASIDIMAGVK